MPTPRPVRPLPNTPSEDLESGIETGLVTRIVIVATIVVGQLFALTVALEASLLDLDGQAWILAGFSLVSFAVVLVLTKIDPPPRSSRLRGHAATAQGTYVPAPATRAARPRDGGSAERGPDGAS
jgi:hypothetical protein